MKKPVNLLYGVDDVPPVAVTLLSGLQQVGLISIMLVYPLLVSREAGVSQPAVLDILSISMIVIGLGAILQGLSRGPVGSGFLCPPVATAIYLVPSLDAAKMGGLPLVFGMTMFAGLIEAALARIVRFFRPFFPPELTGFVVAMIAVTTGAVGIRYMLGVGSVRPGDVVDLTVAAVSLGTMIVLNVWTKGFPRLFCVLIGMVAGYGSAVVVGSLTPSDLRTITAAPLVSAPRLGQLAWSFDGGLAIPFFVAALAACLKVIGNVTTCQSMNDADWRRPDFRSISGGVLADGLSTVSAGLLGTVGVNTSSGSVGLSAATGVASRAVAYVIGGLFFVFAFFPKVSGALAIMPRPVMGSALLFSAAFFFVSGLQIITSRMLDARKTIVIGVSFMAGISVDIYPAFFSRLPGGARPFVGSSLVLGTVLALVLNLVFRLGTRRTQILLLDSVHLDSKTVEDFMEAQGAAWGARRDVIDRASFNLTQSLETIVEACGAKGPIEIEASFDEFRLDVRVSYDGAPLELPERRPSNEEIMASEDGQRRLAGFILRRYADRVQTSHKAGRSTILFHFDH